MAYSARDKRNARDKKSHSKSCAPVLACDRAAWAAAATALSERILHRTNHLYRTYPRYYIVTDLLRFQRMYSLTAVGWPAVARTARDRAFSMCLERKARVRRTMPPPESVVAGWYENASLLDSYSIDLSSSKQYSMRVLATRTVGDPPAWITALVAARDALWRQNQRRGPSVQGRQRTRGLFPRAMGKQRRDCAG